MRAKSPSTLEAERLGAAHPSLAAHQREYLSKEVLLVEEQLRAQEEQKLARLRQLHGEQPLQPPPLPPPPPAITARERIRAFDEGRETERGSDGAVPPPAPLEPVGEKAAVGAGTGGEGVVERPPATYLLCVRRYQDGQAGASPLLHSLCKCLARSSFSRCHLCSAASLGRRLNPLKSGRSMGRVFIRAVAVRHMVGPALQGRRCRCSPGTPNQHASLGVLHELVC